MDPLTILVIIGAVVVIIWMRQRNQRSARGPTVTFEVAEPRSRARRGAREPLTRVADVTPIGPPLGWPVLPPQPAGLDGAPPPEEYVAVADREYVRTTCPSCGMELNPLPRAKKRCKECGKEIFVRSGPGGKRHLLAATELEGFEVLWAQHHETRSLEASSRQEQALAEWRRLLADGGIQVGDYELDVVGESYRHPALAGIRASLVESPNDFEVRAVAALEREPENRHDRNAIRVMIHGQMVGYLDRYEAEDYQAVLKQARGPFYVQAVLLGGRPDGAYVGPIGVRLEDVPEP